MKILLLCNQGMSTSLLTHKMQELLGDGDSVEALSDSEFMDSVDGVDVVLLGPQIRYMEAEVRALAEPLGIKVGVVESRVYGTMDGRAAVQQAQALLAE